MHSFWSTGIGTSAAPAAAATDYRDGPSQRLAAIAALGAGRERRAKRRNKRLLVVMTHVYTHLTVIQEHDDFCDSLHLDGVVFPVAPVFNPATGAQRVIIPGRITATR